MSKKTTAGSGEFGRKPLGLVWVCSDDPLLGLGFEHVLGPEMDLCCERELPVGRELSCAVCPYGEEVGEELGRIRGLAPDVPVLVYGLDVDQDLARTGLLGGASGYIHAGMKPSQMVRAVSLASEGRVVIPKGLLGEPDPSSQDLAALTHCQLSLLELVAEGMTDVQIVRHLRLPEGVVKQSLGTACDALGAPNETEAARFLGR